MWQCQYAKEPFDLKLFTLRCMRKLHWILLGCIAGALLIGGIYYLKNVTFGGKVPYQVTKKLDMEYAVNPDTGEVYSYYVAYTWNDWIWSDVFTEGLLQRLPEDMTKEEVIAYYEMTLPSDVRNPQLVVIHPNAATAEALAEYICEELLVFSENQEEIKYMKVIDTVGPVPKLRDIRTFRAVILGAVIGTFFALFGLAFQMALDAGIFLPETFYYRHQIPTVGFIDKNGVASEEVKQTISYLFQGKKQVAITAVEPELDLTSAKKYFENAEAVCIPSVLQVPESLEILREKDGVLLMFEAGRRNGKAIESVLYLCRIHEIPVTAALLVGADRNLIRQYRFSLNSRREA